MLAHITTKNVYFKVTDEKNNFYIFGIYYLATFMVMLFLLCFQLKKTITIKNLPLLKITLFNNAIK